MHRLWLELTALLKPFFDARLFRAESGCLTLRDDELNGEASCCTMAQVASFYAAHARLHGGDGDRTAAELIRTVRANQLPSGAFSQPYYVKHGEEGTVDIAEIGAAANALYHVYRATDEEAARAALAEAADYLLTQVAQEQPGAVYKNPNARMHDVLNGDIYAAHTLGRAHELTGKPEHAGKAVDIVRHIADRFGKHGPGWWPYIEHWDGSVGMGNSVSYQGTIVAFAYTLHAILPPDLSARWSDIEREALWTMMHAMDEGPNDDNEAPWWCRDWSNSWEIWLSLSRRTDIPEAAERCLARMTSARQSLEADGLSMFRPKVRHDDPERTPVTTTFRKTATFAGIVSYMILDSLKR